MQLKEEPGHQRDIPKLGLHFVLMRPFTIISDQLLKLVTYKEQQAQNTLSK